MPKVIVERPRYGHRMRGPGKGYKRRTARIPWDEQPRRERLRQTSDTKRFSERLGPLVRFFQHRVGRLWAQVEAEICAHLRRDNVIQDHVRDHLAEMVVTHVYLVKNRPHHGAGYMLGLPIRAGWGWMYRFYVCPRTGLLKAALPSRRRQTRVPWEMPLPPIRLIAHGYEQYWLCQRGVWLLATFERIPPRLDLYALEPECEDAVHHRKFTRAQAKAIYGRAIHATAVRAATRKEVQRYCK